MNMRMRLLGVVISLKSGKSKYFFCGVLRVLSLPEDFVRSEGHVQHTRHGKRIQLVLSGLLQQGGPGGCDQVEVGQVVQLRPSHLPVLVRVRGCQEGGEDASEDDMTNYVTTMTKNLN